MNRSSGSPSLRAVTLFLLAPLAVPVLWGCRGIDDTPQFQAARTRAVLSIAGEALIQFKAETGRFPKTELGLEELTRDISNRGSVLRAVPKDGWGRFLVYKLADASNSPPFDLYSLGPNGVDDRGLRDDISYWSEQVQQELRSGEKNQ